MPLPDPEPGLVICYSYLWDSEHEEGREEGIKDRPCAIVLMTRDDEGVEVITVVPVTHIPPQNSGEALEIPPKTKRRLGLDSERSWVILTETNSFAWPGPDLRPVSRKEPERFDYGLLPPLFFRQIKEGLLARMARKKVKAISRNH